MLRASWYVRQFSTSQSLRDKLRVAIIGQSQFAVEVYRGLLKDGHKVVGVFTVPDVQGRPDPLASEAEKDDIKVFKFKRWRQKGAPLAEVLDQYRSVEADLNVMPYTSQFIPMEVIDAPKHRSIVYHPSILPVHKGASAINWTLINGDRKAGFSIFWADDGLDTGEILLQRECFVRPDDTVDSLYNRFMFPVGINAMREAVQLVSEGRAPKIVQKATGSSYDPMLNKKALAEIKSWDRPAQELHNYIRGMDHSPGAWAAIDGHGPVTFYGSSMWRRPLPMRGVDVAVAGMSRPALVHAEGMLLFGNDGKALNVRSLELEGGKMIKANKFGQDQEEEELIFTPEEEQMVENMKAVWNGILQIEIEDATDFFKSGAGSMEVTRLVEEVKDCCDGLELVSEDVYMGTTFAEFVRNAIVKSRGGGGAKEVEFEPVNIHTNNMDLRFPRQLFINNEFIDSESGRTYPTINPNDESVICEVSKASAKDVDYAVHCAKEAFYSGEWGKMSARERQTIMYKLADLMDEHRQELATLESLDSGAVYTLALKTHVGMSIDTFRYMAGWCDKIHGQTIPISHARPSRNMTVTRREPIGVCGIVTPWNYPLMMLAWKMSACLAAGNTVVLKPAQVCPLTALKFAELVVKAGFPPGVINILPGSGSECGQAIADHPDVRKLGFTGSTEIGVHIMRSCASNVKKVSLELGGKSPLIIFADCDIDRAVRQAMGAVFFNKGENCIAAGRLFVAESIHDVFVDKVVTEVKKMKVGDPLDRSTAHGPQNHKAHLDKLVEYCERGVKEGAKLVLGGKQIDRKGLFMEPTIFMDVEDDMYIASEESFGPVMIISKFDDMDVDGVIARANATEFGLASGVFTKDINKALHIAENIQAGTVFVNTYNKTDVAAPFGGFKQSGFGKDLGQEALNEYLKTKTVTFEYETADFDY